MPTIKNTKTLAECLSLKKESVTEKLLLERIGMEPTLPTKLYDKLIEADPCWYKVDNFYFVSCPPEIVQSTAECNHRAGQNWSQAYN